MPATQPGLAEDSRGGAPARRPLALRWLPRSVDQWQPWVGLAMLVLVVGYSLVLPLLPGYDPYGQDLTKSLLAPGADPAHILGTDSLGRDTASRLALAGRVTLLAIVIIIVANAVIGMVIGTLSGYFGGKLDNALMALADIQLAMPMILVLTALAAVRGPSVTLMVAALSLTFWVGYARVARTTARSLRERDFVLAPKLQGATTARIIRTHVLPSVGTQMLILASTDIGTIILLMSAFDYLGLGVQAPLPSWGSMIGDSQRYMREEAWQAIIPGIAIFLAVSGTNLFSQKFTGENSAARLRRTSRKSARRTRKA
ncbi:ABC transporter permease [Microbacterium sp. gxy059]|uniref:ABC transporter permease n=1 Tax=Microbacterium sp. gxy059 TaxID=2957199 RepID=UPI003D95229F